MMGMKNDAAFLEMNLAEFFFFFFQLNLYTHTHTHTHTHKYIYIYILGFPCGSVGKETACNVGDQSLIPGLGRSPGDWKGYPLQYSGPENSVDCIVHRVAKSWTGLSDFYFYFHFHIYIYHMHQNFHF